MVAIYSTFLQRAYDQIFHDVCLMHLPVVFVLDRGGLVGADGPTHHGVFDLSYLRIFPEMVVMAPKDEDELRHMLATALAAGRPVALRYPRGNGYGVAMDAPPRALPIGKAEVLRQGRDGLVWAIGTMASEALRAAERLAAEAGPDLTVVNARFVKPLDVELLAAQLRPGTRLMTVEENALAGGFGSAVQEAVATLRVPDVAGRAPRDPGRVSAARQPGDPARPPRPRRRGDRAPRAGVLPQARGRAQVPEPPRLRLSAPDPLPPHRPSVKMRR